MEMSKQIKKYRLQLHLSQEELADKIFVTRQTISNWENGKNYPDINSIVLLSTLFGISLDILVKGDLEEMKECIKNEDIQKLQKDGIIFSILLVATVVSVVPLFLMVDGYIGIVAWVVLFGISMYYALRIEKQKKVHDVQTYKEVIAFSEGKRLDEIERNREYGKRPYQKLLYAIVSGIIGFVVTMILLIVFGYL
ncbi:helix-turn-helix domain-containing protein [Candidatus Stoquefichus sp. SB1]|uniref:helix-turn-helix domain-containing protein n=1 Tax=Candidatus Stoquefichus sp. SB1 TaxID=1658109 RepID=UPI00067EFB58|nr:helix-turn-helix transcriptional regulator [Candidatus Stoquefichus sp. SB1]